MKHQEVKTMDFEIGKLEGQVENLTHVIVDLRATLDRIGRRLEALEKENYLWRGGLTVVLSCGVMVSSVGTIAVNFFR